MLKFYLGRCKIIHNVKRDIFNQSGPDLFTLSPFNEKFLEFGECVNLVQFGNDDSSITFPMMNISQN